MTALNRMVSELSRMVAKIGERLDEKEDKDKKSKMMVDEYTTITAGSTRQYDLHTLLGAELAKYSCRTADILVRVKDTNPTSPLFNLYANAESIVSYGVTSNERYVTIANQANTPIELYVRVVIYPVGV